MSFDSLSTCHLIWHIYCTITHRTKIHGAKHSRKSPVIRETTKSPPGFDSLSKRRKPATLVICELDLIWHFIRYTEIIERSNTRLSFFE